MKPKPKTPPKRLYRITEEPRVDRVNCSLRVRVESHRGSHLPGSKGLFLSTADGLGTYFPEGGGCVFRLRVESVKRLPKAKEAPRVKSPRPASLRRRVKRVRKVTRTGDRRRKLKRG